MTTTEIIRELQRRRDEEQKFADKALSQDNSAIWLASMHRKAVLCEVLQWILERQLQSVGEVIEPEIM